ncbi:hypothetical protein VMCG_09607 [Cytospora schulzeri]|uniref:Uncharacterized protein n=1 Tax=Cytospora schulzeri TaxID=448051 RepID=A0A423VJB0_9PEZI|nr:hypothetical protein VMCG_09607 [Valsa malicola]
MQASPFSDDEAMRTIFIGSRYSLWLDDIPGSFFSGQGLDLAPASRTGYQQYSSSMEATTAPNPTPARLQITQEAATETRPVDMALGAKETLSEFAEATTKRGVPRCSADKATKKEVDQAEHSDKEEVHQDKHKSRKEAGVATVETSEGGNL